MTVSHCFLVLLNRALKLFALKLFETFSVFHVITFLCQTVGHYTHATMTEALNTKHVKSPPIYWTKMNPFVWRKKKKKKKGRRYKVKNVYADVRFSPDTWRMIHVPFVPKCSFCHIQWPTLFWGSTSLGRLSAIWRPGNRSGKRTSKLSTYMSWCTHARTHTQSKGRRSKTHKRLNRTSLITKISV